jgi:uncharacterized protein YjbI with pentapeptide repeats
VHRKLVSRIQFWKKEKTKPQLAEIGVSDLVISIRNHSDWVRAGQPLNQLDRQLNLKKTLLPEKANFRGKSLAQAIFVEACSKGADFTEADLTGANFRRADLTGTLFVGANCTNTDFTESKLRDADLTGCHGLNMANLAGADLTGAIPPIAIAGFKMLDNVADSAKQAQTLFITLLAACTYSWLTISSTKDVDLLSNSTTSPLPILSTAIPIAGFYFVVPILLVLLFDYFHIALLRLWEMLGDLPAIFPEGVPLDKRTSPWLLSGLIRSNLLILKSQTPPLANLQAFVSMLLAYWTVPITLVWYWIRYLPRHEWVGSSLHEGLILLCIGLALLFSSLSRAVLARRKTVHCLYIWMAPAAILLLGDLVAVIVSGLGLDKSSRSILEAISPQPFLPQDVRGGAVALALLCVFLGAGLDLLVRHHLYYDVPPTRPEILRRLAVPIVAVAVVTSVLGVMTFGSIEAIRSEHPAYDARRWVHKVWRVFGFDVFANLSDVDVSHNTPKAGDATVKRAAARFNKANLAYSTVHKAYLEDVTFANAVLPHSDLSYAHLRDADFSFADLHGSSLEYADLTGTNLSDANLAKTHMTVARGLLAGQVRLARAWQLSALPIDLYRSFELTGPLLRPSIFSTLTSLRPRVFDLQDLDLSRISLKGIDLRLAVLKGANLAESDVTGAKIFNTDFRGALNLTVDQIRSMSGWRFGQYDEVLLDRLGLDRRHNDRIEHSDVSGEDLRGVPLDHLDLRNWKFQKAKLSGVKFDGSFLFRVDFSGSDLSDAIFDHAYVYLSDLRGAKTTIKSLGRCITGLNFVDPISSIDHHNYLLQQGDLTGANLKGCSLFGLVAPELDLSGANLSDADLRGIQVKSLRKANLGKANVVFAHLDRSGVTSEQKQAVNIEFAFVLNGLKQTSPATWRDFDGRKLANVRLEDVDLSFFKFRSADLSKARFDGALLTGTDFKQANLKDATFDGAELEWADFRDARNLTATQITKGKNWNEAYFDATLLRDLNLPADHNGMVRLLHDQVTSPK